MDPRNALQKMLATAGGAAAVALLLLAGPAHAAGIDDCLTRTSMGSFRTNDLVNVSVTGPQTGNFWARLDGFAIDPEEECGSVFISEISVLLKTPFQITPNPDIDDVDSAAHASVLQAELDLAFPEFSHYGFNAIVEAGGQSPSDFATFHGVSVCLYVGVAGSIAGCLAGGPTVLVGLDGGTPMRFAISLGGDAFTIFEDCEGECDPIEFQLVTVMYSTAFNEQIGNDHPEAIMGWHFVPEPAPLALLATGLLGWAFQRRKLLS